MKALKKLSCVLLAVLLLMSLTVTAFAEGDGSITVTKALEGQTYTLYKIFDFVPVEGHDTTTDDVQGMYTVVPAWLNFIKTWVNEETGFTLDEESDPVQVMGIGEKFDAAAFAAAALDYAKGEAGITAVASQKAGGAEAKVTGKTLELKFTGLDFGYYLVDSTTGALVSLNTAGPSVNMTEKNSIPTISKAVQEDNGGAWGAKNHDDVGKTVNFKSVIHVEKGAQGYVMHDVMSDVLAWNEDSVVVTGASPDDDYTVVVPSGEGADDCTFEVKFADAFVQAHEGEDIEVTYSAVITDAAEINTGIPNDVDLEYGDGNRTEKSHTDTYTYGFKLMKYKGTRSEDGTNPEEVRDPLAGAKFVLQNKTAGEFAKFSTKQTGTDKLSLIVQFDGWVTAQTDATELETPASGLIEFEGLDADFYTVTETAAPEGYNKADPFEIEIQANATYKGELYIRGEEAPEGAQIQLDVPNYTGLELPETGGIGTTIFYAVGGVLVAAALVLLITKKRMTKES